jgi:UrcA family protein
MRLITLGAAVAALTPILLVSPASAGPRDVTITARAADADQLQKRVSYRDLNLAVSEGQRTLHQRVRRATAEVCAPLFNGSNFDRSYRLPQLCLGRRRAADGARHPACRGNLDCGPEQHPACRDRGDRRALSPHRPGGGVAVFS